MVKENTESLAECAAELRNGALRIARRFRAERPSGGLSPNQLGVLTHLFRDGPATPGEIAANRQQQPQTLTRVFADLERNGFLTRTRSERDHRQVVLEITQSGREALRQDVADRDAWLASALAGLTETERQVLRLAAALMDRISDFVPAGPRPDGDAE